MNFWKAIFGGRELTAEEEQQERKDKNFDLLKYDGVKAMKMGQADYAVRCFEEALKLTDDMEVRDYLSQTLMRLGRFDEAMEHLKLMAEAEPENVVVRLQMANVAYMKEDYGLLESICQQALATMPDDERLYFFAARASVGLEQPEQALDRLDRALQLRDDYADARLLRGRVLLKLGRIAEADADSQWLIDYAGSHEDVLMFKAQVETAKGDAEAARHLYSLVIEVNPFSAQAYLSRAALLDAMGLHDEAQADRQQARELDPEQNEEDIEQQVKQAYKNASPFGI